MNSNYGFIAILFALVFARPLIAEETYQIAAGPFLGIIQEDGQGPYQLILREAAKRADIQLEESVYPLARAVKTFTNKQAIAIYSMEEPVIAIIGEHNILTTFPLGVNKAYIFTRKGSPVIKNYQQLKDLEIGGVNGYQAYYQNLTDHGVNIYYFIDEAKQLERFELGRIDAIIGFLPDWIPFLDKLDYSADFPVHIGYDCMTVWNTPTGQQFVDKISPVLMQMKTEGTIEKLLGDRYMDYTYSPTKKYQWLPLTLPQTN